LKVLKKKFEYWNDLHKSTGKDVIFFISGNTFVTKRITISLCKEIALLFSGRKIVIYDNFPTNDLSPNIIFLNAYQGREVGIDKYLHGVVSNPMDKYSISQIPLMTVFDYLRSPNNYNPSTSLKSSLISLLVDDRLSEDMFYLINVAPNSVIASEVSDTAAKLVRLDSPAFFTDIQERISRLRFGLPKSFVQDLETFFQLLDSLIKMNTKFFEYQSSLDLENTKLQETIRNEFREAVKGLEVLLHPNLSVINLNSTTERLNSHYFNQDN